MNVKSWLYVEILSGVRHFRRRWCLIGAVRCTSWFPWCSCKEYGNTSLCRSFRSRSSRGTSWLLYSRWLCTF